MTYFANGSEGSYLDEQCENCLIGVENFCPIALVQCEFNYNQIIHEKGLERFKGEHLPLLSSVLNCLIEDGNCRMKKEIDEALKRIEEQSK